MQYLSWKPTLSLGVVLLLAESPGWTTETIYLPAPSRQQPELEADGDAPDGEAIAWEEMLQALETLWSGDCDERLDVLAEAEYLFGPLEEPGEERSEDADHVVASLTAFFDAEDDEWILDRLALGLAEIWEESLNPLFDEMLLHPSPNLRWRAIYHFAMTDGPAAAPKLRRLMRTEERPWIRIDLLEALEMQEVEGFLEQCVPWIDSDDVSLAVETIEYLAGEDVEGALPALLERATDGPPPVRAAAVRALSGWPDSREALATVIEATRSSDVTLQRAALQTLDSFPYEGALRRQEEISRSADAHPCLRATAATALATPETPETFIELWSNVWRDCVSVPRWEWSGHVTPLATMDSVRCWRGPEIAGDPDEYPRIPANTTVEIYDRFEARDGLWIEMMNLECWVPMDQVAEGPPEIEPAVQPLVEEVDIATDQLATTMVLSLIDAGLLEVFDPHPSVVGVALVVDPGLADDIELLLEVYEEGESVLHAAITSALERSVELGELDDDLLDRARGVVEPANEVAVAEHP